MVHKSLLKSGLRSRERAAHQEGPQVLPGTSLLALLWGLREMGPLGFVRGRIPIDLVKKLRSAASNRMRLWTDESRGR